jgi:hypothetical protein
MKSTILLTIALFLASAPSPDAKTISEFSAGFLVLQSDYGLMASDPVFSSRSEKGASARMTDLLAKQENELNKQKDGSS